jgi:hypothetical protein
MCRIEIKTYIKYKSYIFYRQAASMDSTHIYKEIEYLEEEIKYWMTEYQLNPSEEKITKIRNLNKELKYVKKQLPTK